MKYTIDNIEYQGTLFVIQNLFNKRARQAVLEISSNPIYNALYNAFKGNDLTTMSFKSIKDFGSWAVDFAQCARVCLFIMNGLEFKISGTTEDGDNWKLVMYGYGDSIIDADYEISSVVDIFINDKKVFNHKIKNKLTSSLIFE